MKTLWQMYAASRRYRTAVYLLRLEAERTGTDRQMRRYLNALADMIEGKR